jgi:hypothetical protein
LTLPNGSIVPATAQPWQTLPDGSVIPATWTLPVVGQVKTEPPACPAMAESCWFTQMFQRCASSCRNLTTMCTGRECPQTAAGCAMAAGCAQGHVQPVQWAPQPVTCEREINHILWRNSGQPGFRIYPVPQGVASFGSGCPVAQNVYFQVQASGATPSAPCCEAQHLLQYVQSKVAPSAPCCCSKACACCEACKSKSKTGTWVFVPTTRRVIEVRPATPVAPPAPATRVLPCPMLPADAPTWIAPPPMMLHTHVSRVASKPARLVTPEFEAHCDRMTNQGDLIVLDGNVLLLCKKHARPIRIEAQRVVVNMKDGSFRVENGSPSTTSSFGVMRTGVIESSHGHFRMEIAPMRLPAPGVTVTPHGILHGVPVPQPGVTVPK